MVVRPLARQAGALFASLADFVFPPFCAACRRRMPQRERGTICADCWGAYQRWPAGACQRCGQALPVSQALPASKDSPVSAAMLARQDEVLCEPCRIPGWGCSTIRTPGPFAKPVSDAVHLLKYSDRRSIARDLAGMMAEAVRDDPCYRGADLVLAVPLHAARLRERGYNQAQLLADQLAVIIDKPSPGGVLARTKHTGSQTKLGRLQRQENMRDVFRVRRPHLVREKTVILVDDVLTTGATIGSCGQSLLRAGAARVLALTAAAAPLA